MKNIVRKILGLMIGIGGIVLIVGSAWQYYTPRAIVVAAAGLSLVIVGLMVSSDLE